MEKFVVANWKQNKNLSEIEVWFKDFTSLVAGNLKNTVVVLGMSFPYLYKSNFDEGGNVYIAAQDVSMYEGGAHTGEVGASQVRDFCKFCIVGHSERSESFDVVSKKVDNCYSADVIPIICFVNPDEVKKYYRQGALLAWEDPDNISKKGVFNPKSPENVQKTVNDIKSQLPSDAKILYGGSVNRQNASDLSKISELDGVLVGSASLDPAHFFEIIKAFEI